MWHRRDVLTATLLFVLAASVFTLAQGQRPNLLMRLTTQPQTSTVFGQRLVYYEAGRGRTLVLLANLAWDSQMWAQNLPALAQNHHVIALDVIGTGESAKPHLDYKMDTWTDFIAEFLRVKGIAKATVAGAVMGGALSVQFALDHPEMSEGLICAASNSGPGHEGGSPRTGGGPWPSLAGIRRGLLSGFYDKSLVTDDLVRARFEQRLHADDGYTVERHLSDHREPYSPEELSKIRVPALFVWCRQDQTTPLSWGEAFAAAVPGAQLAVIDACGHFPNLEKPAEFNQAVIEFLDKRTPVR